MAAVSSTDMTAIIAAAVAQGIAAATAKGKAKSRAPAITAMNITRTNVVGVLNRWNTDIGRCLRDMTTAQLTLMLVAMGRQVAANQNMRTLRITTANKETLAGILMDEITRRLVPPPVAAPPPADDDDDDDDDTEPPLGVSGMLGGACVCELFALLCFSFLLTLCGVKLARPSGARRCWLLALRFDPSIVLIFIFCLCISS